MDNHLKGVLMALLAATLWGVSGTCGQFLFQERAMAVEWLMAVRMLGAGILLLLVALLRKDRHMWLIWRDRSDRRRLLIFGILGMLTVQYSYFAAIKHSNAATATILQFSAPVLIAIYLAVRYGKRLNAMGYLAIFLAVLGTFLLVTHGNIRSLSISPLAFALGMASAVSLALYTLMPGRLLDKYSALSVIGWGLFIGGVAISLLRPPWDVAGIEWDEYTYANTLFVVLFGTLVPFYVYLKAVQLIGGQKASLLTSAEPLSATLLAVLWLGVSFQALDWLGALLIVSTVFLLSVGKVSGDHS
ncbi:DMT family transporter [Parapedobacter sp. GCM10030251]|uniref:DMT family transporter n=1 Tax=Parapedobacter sp. GCM10030251 TaxID=3273419 RepID=UPI003620C8A5